MSVVAIDPGSKGGWASTSGCGRLWAKTGIMYDPVTLSKILIGNGNTKLVVETPFSHVPRGQAVTSLTRSHQLFGQIKGVALHLGLEIIEIRPVDWVKVMGLTKKPKAAHTAAARQLYPEYALDELKYACDDGTADALLILSYYMRHLK